MKKILLSLAVVLVFTSTQLSALSLVHYWNFNGTNVPFLTDGTNKDVVTSPLTAIQADLSLTSTPATLIYRALAGTASPFMSYWDLVGADTGSSLNARNGDIAGDCLRPRDAWSSMEFVLNIPTTGFNNPKIMYDVQRSGSGPTVNTYYYSVDGGVNWITAGLSTPTNTVVIPTTGFLTQTVTITDLLANNNANLQFKILFSVAAKGAGNNRIDNITVEGDILAAANSPVVNEVSMYPNPCTTGVVNFTNPVDVEVYSLLGKQIKSIAHTQNLNTSDLVKGIYTVRINGTSTQKLIIE